MKCYAVIDTNVVVSAFLSVQNASNIEDSIPFKVLSLILDNKNKIIPIFNDEILKEYREVLSRPFFKISKSVIGKFMNDIRSVGLYFEKAEIFEQLPDPKDVVFYQVVMEGKKTQESYLVTGNQKHFPQKDFVVTPTEFLNIVSEKK